MSSKKVFRWALGLSFIALFAGVLSGCTYRYQVGYFAPAGEEEQTSGVKVLDDGTVLYVQERLEIGLRAMTDAELNRQFPEHSQQGLESTNPYTYGNWVPIGESSTPSRFTVFLLSVKNYTYPKMLVDPSKLTIVAKNGRVYFPWSREQIEEYYLPFIQGYAGNTYEQFERRKDILKRTLYPAHEFIFSGQESSGYVVFPRIDDDVREITVYVNDIVLRFDSWGRPAETIDLEYHFYRDVKKVYYPLLVTSQSEQP